ncbi:hypothetical protein OAZ91_01265 [bacterium]|nr:hypothetical protein [bacterium]
MAHQQTPTINLNLYPQGKFAERCIGFVDDLARWEEANQPRTRALKKQDKLAREATCKILLANLHQTWKRDPAAIIGVLKKTNWYSDHRNTISPLIRQTAMQLLLRFFADRTLIGVVSEGRKHQT